MKSWYVVAREPREGNFYVNVFGPFQSETDARAYAMDLADDNGWDYTEAEQITPEEAAKMATEDVLWPYETENNEEEEDDE